MITETLTLLKSCLSIPWRLSYFQYCIHYHIKKYEIEIYIISLMKREDKKKECDTLVLMLLIENTLSDSLLFRAQICKHLHLNL